jgi:hypothetical protein
MIFDTFFSDIFFEIEPASQKVQTHFSWNRLLNFWTENLIVRNWCSLSSVKIAFFSWFATCFFLFLGGY